jgi:hypothetical protein
MWLLRGWKFDEIERRLSSTEKANSYGKSYPGLFKGGSSRKRNSTKINL